MNEHEHNFYNGSLNNQNLTKIFLTLRNELQVKTYTIILPKYLFLK